MDSKNKDIKYKFALIEGSEKLINIESVSKQDRKQNKYICPNCNKELIPALGENNVHHFRHKDDVECDHDGYLHALAERLFVQRFQEDIPLYIKQTQNVKCSEAERCKVFSASEYIPDDEICPLEYINGCMGRIPIKYDLKKDYDTCTREKEIEGFRADFLLEDSKGINKPLLIEIFVTHKCTEKKINSKLRIFEIPIESENDAFNILSSKSLWGTMYNFEVPERIERLHKTRSVKVISLDSSGNSSFKYFRTKCTEIGNWHNERAVLDVCCEEDSKPLSAFYQFALNNGVKIQSCFLCKYYVDSMCVCMRYKTVGTPHKPMHLFANVCPYFEQTNSINTQGLELIYADENEDNKDIISNYRMKYGEGLYEKMECYANSFKAKSLCLRFKDSDDEIYLSAFYDWCVSEINENKYFYSLVFSNTNNSNLEKTYLIFVREGQYLRKNRPNSKTIYVFDEIVKIDGDKICIFTNELISDFPNFKFEELKEDNKNLEVTKNEETDDYYNETESEEIKCLYQKCLGAALSRMKELYAENKLKLKPLCHDAFYIKDRYPFCKELINPDNLYYSLIFNEKDDLFSRDLTIRFVNKITYKHDSRLKEINIYIGLEDDYVLKDNCICYEKDKIMYFNF